MLPLGRQPELQYWRIGRNSTRRSPCKRTRGCASCAYGGGIYALSSTVTLQSCTVNANNANGSVVGEGGGIFDSNSALMLVATPVKGNKATTAFGDIGP